MKWQASMISAGADFSSAPLFRKEFSVESGHGAITRALLRVSAQGIVEPYLGGHRVSEDVLTPGWSSYEWRTRYATYEVKDQLKSGTNVLGLSGGSGWYRGRLGWTGKGEFYGAGIAVIAQLDIEFEDQHVQVVATGEDWLSGPSAVLFDDLYDGQTIDAGLADDAWLQSGASLDVWVHAKAVPFDVGTLEPYIGPPARRCLELTVLQVMESPSGARILDFGQNLVGWLKVKVKGPRGSRIVLRHAEVLEHGELGVRPLRSAKATDTFILSGGDDVFEPTFTFHGFRYAELEGWPGDFNERDVTAVVVSSDLTRTGYFECSEPLLNQFHENVVWGMRGNFLDVPTDCPQRDERLGWTGDIAAFAPTAAYLFNVESFLRDWLKDLRLEQLHNNDIVGFVVPDAIKYFGRPEGKSEVESTALWSDACVWVPWTLYRAYGDQTVLTDQCDSMMRHVRRVRTLLNDRGVWEGNFQFGDWLDPDAPPEDPAAAKADKGVVATACIYRSARLLAEICGILGLPEQAEFAAFADELRVAFNREYVSNGVVKSDCTTVYALAIAFGLLTDDDTQQAGHRLAELAAAANFRISTGFAGTPFIADALTQTGHVDVAYRLVLERECPSWLYPITMGATTVWERWDSMLPDGSINPGQMTSFNHYALGAVADWMHRVIGGINALEPGYAKVLISPVPGGGLTHANATLSTPHGEVACAWKVEGETLTISASLPDGVPGILRLPDGREETFHGTIERSVVVMEYASA